MDRNILFATPFLVLLSAQTVASNNCISEKAEVDRWNDLLRERVTESRRTHHREAKAKFLDCLGGKNTEGSAQQRRVANPPENHQQEKVSKPLRTARRGSQDMYVSSYHNFKGAKREAWKKYFQESPECKNNSSDMAVFVKCAAERKRYLQEFNNSWDEGIQSLRSPLTGDDQG